MTPNESMIKVTEQSNEISNNIDKCSAKEIVNKLQRCDDEMFEYKVKTYKTVFDAEVLSSVEDLKNSIRSFNISENAKNLLIVLTGSGTSGRMAYFIAKRWNSIMKCDVKYLISGGSRSLVMSQEAPEDDSQLGKQNLEKISSGYSKVLLVAISCAMTAPYAIGQLEYAVKHENFKSFLLGFNSTEVFKSTVKSKNLVEALECGNLTLINPVVGPEAITGSSRMKGGSMTKILLETVFIIAAIQNESLNPGVKSILQLFRRSIRNFYETNKEALSNLVEKGGESLKKGNNISYLASGGTGLLGIIDSAECVPTYGADFEDIRGFMNKDESEFCKEEVFQKNFNEVTFMKKLTMSKESTFLLSTCCLKNIEFKESIFKVQKNNERNNFFFFDFEQNKNIDTSWMKVSNIISIQNKFEELNGCSEDFKIYLTEALNDICAKLTFNCLSTGSFVLKGKVYHNMMIDMKLSNIKLFHRAIGTIKNFCPETSKEDIKNILLEIIYNDSDLETVEKNDVNSHVLRAESMLQVIPCAIVMIKANCTVKEGLHYLKKYNNVTSAINNLCDKNL